VPRNASILLAEPDLGVAASLRRGLQERGLSVAVVRSGEQAEARARAGGPDLLLLGAGDGLEVVRRLRAEGLTLPVVLLADEDDLREKVTALRSGADDYLARPFHLAELHARIRARLREAWPAVYA
jgi:DNA-binding response OmpR family regulator